MFLLLDLAEVFVLLNAALWTCNGGIWFWWNKISHHSGESADFISSSFHILIYAFPWPLFNNHLPGVQTHTNKAFSLRAKMPGMIPASSRWVQFLALALGSSSLLIQTADGSSHCDPVARPGLSSWLLASAHAYCSHYGCLGGHAPAGGSTLFYPWLSNA